MQKAIRRGVTAFFLAFAALPGAQADAPPDFAALSERLLPSVVNISTTQKIKGGAGLFGMPFQELPDTPEFEPFREFFERFGQQQPGRPPQEREVTSLGSGFVIDPSGYIVTNNHVIDEAEEITVTFSDDSKYKAKIVGRDTKTDLALLKIEAKKPLLAVTMGDSDTLRVGDWVLAIGNPYGLGGTVTQGIISARQRYINAGPFDDFLQTDASINRGNSGGPLFNGRGEVIGINTAIFSPSGGSIGIGFAVPTALAAPVIAQLKEYGRTHRGWLGVKIQEVSEEVAESVGLGKPRGALVIEVSKGSPADKAGMKAGDIIIAFDGREVTEMRFLPRMVAETKIGKTVPVTYWRKDDYRTVKLTVGELEEPEDAVRADKEDKDKSRPKQAGVETVMGMDVVPLTPALRNDYGIDEKQEGLVVLDVDPATEATKRGLRPGDVLADVNGEPIKTAADLKKAFTVARKQGRKFALVKVVRGQETAFITLPTVEEKK